MPAQTTGRGTNHLLHHLNLLHCRSSTPIAAVALFARLQGFLHQLYQLGTIVADVH